MTTWSNVVLGGLTLVVLVLQWWVFRRQAKLMERQGEIMAAQEATLTEQRELSEQQMRWRRDEAIGTFYGLAHDLVAEFRNANVLPMTKIAADFSTHPRQVLREASRVFAPSGVGPRSLHHAHRGQPISHGPVAELAVEIPAPAIGGARRRDPTGIAVAGAHRSEAHAAHHDPRAQPGKNGRGPVAELAVVVSAPAIGGARSRDPAGVVEAGAHGREAHSAHHEYRG